MANRWRSQIFTAPGPLRTEGVAVLGHRGASFDAPENTLAAFREALHQGADGIELDVMRCGSGELVVCHDARLDRLAGRPLEVGRTSLSVLRTLDLGLRHGSAHPGEQMPTLAEVLGALPRTAIINIEVKSARFDVGRQVALEIRRTEACQRLLISSFHPTALLGVRAGAPRLPTGLLVEEREGRHRFERIARWIGCQSLHVEHSLCTKERIADWHRSGFAVVAWTVDEAEAVARLASQGVDALISNRPGAVRGMLRRPCP